MNCVIRTTGFATWFFALTFGSVIFSQQQGPYSSHQEIENVAAVNGVPSQPGQSVTVGDQLYSRVGLLFTSHVPDTFFTVHAIYDEETEEVLAISLNTASTHAPNIASAIATEVYHTVEDGTVEFQT
jgi:hypothetical protein